MNEYKFTAEPLEDGCIVRQYRDGVIVTQGFVGTDEYEIFCKAIGVTPELQ